MDPYKPLLLQEMQASTKMVQSWLGKHEASSKTYSMVMEEFAGMHPGHSHQVDRTPWTELWENQAAETLIAKTVNGLMAKLLTASGKASATRAVELSLLLEDWLSCPCPADGSCGQGLRMCSSHSNPLLSLFCCLIIDVGDQNHISSCYQKGLCGVCGVNIPSNTLYILFPFAFELLCFPPVLLEQVIKSRQELSL